MAFMILSMENMSKVITGQRRQKQLCHLKFIEKVCILYVLFQIPIKHAQYVISDSAENFVPPLIVTARTFVVWTILGPYENK